jgi:hypothetical protein
MKLRTRSLALMLAVAACLAATVGDADANPYTVSVCNPGAGNANNAMSYSANDYVQISDKSWCDGPTKGAGVQLWSSSGAQGKDAGAWWFYAPTGTTITGVSYTADFSAWNGWVANWATQMNGAGDPAPGGDCPSTSCNRTDGGFDGGAGVSAAVNSTLLGFGIWCHAASCPANDGSSIYGPAASANVYEANITVNDPGPPSVSAGGNLWGLPADQWIAGNNWTVSFGASDPAGPCELQAVIVNSAGATVLSDTSGDVSPDFTDPAPCGAASRTLSWTPDIASLPTGTYSLHVQSNDPAGMSSPDAVEQLNVDNDPTATEVLADRASRLARKCRVERRERRCALVALRAHGGPLKLGFGGRGEVWGLLETAQGTPIASVGINVVAQPLGGGASNAGTVTTNAAGRFAYRVPPGPSRTLTFAFPGTSTLGSAAGTATVEVAGRGTLRLARGPLRAGRTAVFFGRVLGHYIPPGGKLVQLRYRLPGSRAWSPFGPDIYTSQNGDWRVRIRLGASARGYRYELEALLPAQADWPYGRAVSNTETRRIR